MWHLVGAGAPRGAAGPSPGQVWPAVANCSRPWPSCGRLWTAVVRPSLARLRPDLARCGWSCTVALVHPSMVHFSIVYSHICVPTKNVNTTHGTLLVPKMCMKLVYSSQTRGFDGRIFVVRIVNWVVLGSAGHLEHPQTPWR
jgi:hypothetical protein